MRRNCPHCGADQVVADEKLTAGFIFLKCHHCSMATALQGKASQRLIQFSERPVRSLARRDEPRVDLVKPVLSLPPVPQFLKPEKKTEGSAQKAVQAPVQVQAQAPTPAPVQKPLSEPIAVATKPVAEPAEPLLFEPEDQVTAPIPILLEEEKPPFALRDAAEEFAEEFKSRLRNLPRHSVEFAQTVRPYSLPLLLAVVCFGSGTYLIRSAKQIREGAWILPIQTPAQVASDVAPASESFAQQTQAPQTAAPAVGQVSAQAQNSSASSPSAATAPNRAPAAVAQSAAAAAPSEEKVQVLAGNAVLRAGPGLHYNKVGTARAELQLLVKGTFEDWIEVRTGGGAKTAWIRSDLVKPLQPEAKQVAHQEAQP